MPPMDIAAASVAFIQIGIQTVNGIVTLIHFIEDVKEAPEGIRKLKNELQLLLDIVQGLQTLRNEDVSAGSPMVWADAQKSLLYTKELVMDVFDTLRACMPDGGMGKRERLRNSLIAVFRTERYKKLFADIERAKSQLQLALQLVESHKSSQQNLLLRDISQFQVTSTSQTKDLRHDLSRVIDNTNDINRNIYDTSAVTITQLGEIKEDIAQVRDGLLANFNDCGGPAAWLLKKSLDKMIQDAVRDELRRTSTETYAERTNRRGSEDSTDTYVENNGRRILEYSADTCVEQRSLSSRELAPKSTTQDTHLRGENEDVLDNAVGQFGNLGELRITKDMSSSFIYHNALVGTLTVSRENWKTKIYNMKENRFDEKDENLRTTLHLRLSPWLSNKAYVIRLNKVFEAYKHPSPSFGLDHVRYVNIPWEARDAIRYGNLSALQQILDKGVMMLKDKDASTGYNLLDYCMESLESDWYYSEMEKNPQKQKDPRAPAPDHIADIVEISLWLLVKGLNLELHASDFTSSSVIGYLSLEVAHGNVPRNVYMMERFLIDSTGSALPLNRMRLLALFVMLNPEHSTYLETVIWDLLWEGVSEGESAILEEAERVFWKDRLVPCDVGMETVFLCSAIKTLDKTCTESELDIRRGPRRLLLATIAIRADLSEEDLSYNYVRQIANLLRFFKPLNLLDDGFGDHVRKYAGKYDALDPWNEALFRVGLPVEVVRKSDLDEATETLASTGLDDSGVLRWSELDKRTEHYTSIGCDATAGSLPSTGTFPVQSQGLLSLIKEAGGLIGSSII